MRRQITADECKSRREATGLGLQDCQRQLEQEARHDELTDILETQRLIDKNVDTPMMRLIAIVMELNQ